MSHRAEMPALLPGKPGGSMRGQTWTIDFIMGTVVLLFVMINFILLWNSISLRWSLVEKHLQMESSACFASESLLATPGEPEGWEMLPSFDGNVSALGLASGRNELNRMKCDRLVAENATNYALIKDRLGLQRYEFGMQVTDLSRNTVHYTFGRFSGGGLNNTLSFDRFAVLDGDPVVVHMEVWGR